MPCVSTLINLALSSGAPLQRPHSGAEDLSAMHFCGGDGCSAPANLGHDVLVLVTSSGMSFSMSSVCMVLLVSASSTARLSISKHHWCWCRRGYNQEEQAAFVGASEPFKGGQQDWSHSSSACIPSLPSPNCTQCFPARQPTFHSGAQQRSFLFSVRCGRCCCRGAVCCSLRHCRLVPVTGQQCSLPLHRHTVLSFGKFLTSSCCYSDHMIHDLCYVVGSVHPADCWQALCSQ